MGKTSLVLNGSQRAEAWNGRGVAAQRAGDAARAAECYRNALRLRPDWHPVRANLSAALLECGDIAGGTEAAMEALRLDPTCAAAHNALGCALLETRDVAAAVGAFRQALRLDPKFPDAHANLGTALLLLGNLQDGFREREWRRKIDPIHRREGKAWTPSTSSGQARSTSSGQVGSDPFGHTILLCGEGGLGNVIQFSRYVPVAAGMGARIVLECQKELHPLLSNLPGVWKVCSYGEKADGWDLHCPLASLPAILGTTLQSIPPPSPPIGQRGSSAICPHPNPLAGSRLIRSLLPAGEGARGRIHRQLDFGELSRAATSNQQLRRIGVCWRGDQRVPHLRSRSFDPMHLLALAQIPGVELINLQHGVNPPADLPLTTLPGLEPQRMTLEGVALAMQDLDLVITCDTSIAHLAGAMGVPVWVALKHAPCWRWMLDRENSPWYPTMRLFRQDRPGEWKPVFERMARELAGGSSNLQIL